MATEQWIKKLGGHAGELFVCAELSKRGIINALLPENFSDDDIMISNKAGTKYGFIQVKSCHPDRSKSFILTEKSTRADAGDDHYFVFVWLGRAHLNESPKYWISKHREVREACSDHSASGSSNWERRFYVDSVIPPSVSLNPSWAGRWNLFDGFKWQAAPAGSASVQTK